MLRLVLLMLALALQQAPTDQQAGAATAHQHNASARNESPASAANSAAGQNHGAANQHPGGSAESQESASKSFFGFSLTDLLLTIFTGLLVVVGAFQWSALRDQVRRLKETIEKADRDSVARTKEVEKTIQEAARSAAAMERVAGAFEENVEQLKTTVKTNSEIAERQRVFGEMQYRPYVSVLLNNATFQDLKSNLHFAAVPSFSNTGATPARDVTYRAAAAILPLDPPVRFKCWLPRVHGGRNLIAPHSSATPTIIVPQVFEEDEIEDIMFVRDGHHGKRGLFAWGVVSYRDRFDNRYRTSFFHGMYWFRGDDGALRVSGTYFGRHNSAT